MLLFHSVCWQQSRHRIWCGPRGRILHGSEAGHFYIQPVAADKARGNVMKSQGQSSVKDSFAYEEMNMTHWSQPRCYQRKHATKSRLGRPRYKSEASLPYQETHQIWPLIDMSHIRVQNLFRLGMRGTTQTHKFRQMTLLDQGWSGDQLDGIRALPQWSWNISTVSDCIATCKMPFAQRPSSWLQFSSVVP